VDALPEYLYHVTYYGKLSHIAERGLVPSGSAGLGAQIQQGYDYHSRGKTFLTTLDGVFFWHSRFEESATASSDNPLEDGLTPVVLRIDTYASDFAVDPDELGTRDALADAYFTTETIEPDAIDVWNGREWVLVEDADTVDPARAYNFEDDPDSDEQLAFFKEHYDNPLFPPEAAP